MLQAKCEGDDGDFHIDLADSADATTCAVVEVPNPTYISDTTLQPMVAAAEQTAKQLSPGDSITVSGQLFYDMTHGGGASPGGGRGKGYCAQSLWEVHPIFNISKNS
ncbi:MAG: hypothetical protein JO104_12275 [Candidatus Eremiobacteraeota bacterium]|nr:hypothetical protein [Candidatus Eremiobacteraeota bacterium]